MSDDAERIPLHVGVIFLPVHEKLQYRFILDHHCKKSCDVHVSPNDASWVSSLHAAMGDSSSSDYDCNMLRKS